MQVSHTFWPTRELAFVRKRQATSFCGIVIDAAASVGVGEPKVEKDSDDNNNDGDGNGEFPS